MNGRPEVSRPTYAHIDYSPTSLVKGKLSTRELGDLQEISFLRPGLKKQMTFTVANPNEEYEIEGMSRIRKDGGPFLRIKEHRL